MTDGMVHEPAASVEHDHDDVSHLREQGHKLLRNPLAAEAAYETFALHYADTSNPTARGVAGFILMMRALERCSREPQASAGGSPDARAGYLDTATTYLRDLSVVAEMMSAYSLPNDYELREATIYRVGTTSVIFECYDRALRQNIALKCVLFRYSEVPEIASQTAAYADRFDFGPDTRFAPRVFASGPLYIAMEFIHGCTLAECLHTRKLELYDRPSRKRATPTEIAKEQVPFAADLAIQLTEILRTLARPRAASGKPTNHLDLSPSNIILRDGELAPGSVVLVDFGLNYLIAEDIGSTAAITVAGHYVAPECLEAAFLRKPFEDKELADAYSLALVILRCATLDNVSTRRELSLQALWRVAPGYARILEDLLDDNPGRRAVLLKSGQLGRESPGATFSELLTAFREEANAQTTFYDVQDADGLGVVGRTWRQWVVDRQTVKAMVRLALQSRKTANHAYRPFAGLATASAICGFMWLLVLGGFFLFTVPFPGPGLGQAPGRTILEMFRSTYHPKHYVVAEYLPARIVALAFGTLAFTAYMNIFATLEYSGLPRRLGPVLRTKVVAATFFVRTVVFVPFLPMLWVIWYSPKDWPILAVPGTLWAAAANTCAFSVWKEGTARATQVFSADPDPDNAFHEQFKWWGYGMGIFALALAVFAVWFELSAVHDVMPYAIGIAALTIFQVSFGRCIAQGNHVRGRLLRGVFDLRRSLRVAPEPGRQVRPPTPREWAESWLAYVRRRSQGQRGGSGLGAGQ